MHSLNGKEEKAAISADAVRPHTDSDPLRAIYEAAPVGLAMLDQNLRFISINDRLAQWNGVAAADHIGKSVAEILPDLPDDALAGLRKVLSGEAIWGHEVITSTLGKPGEPSCWRENWVPVRAATGDVVGIAISCEDITEERNARRALELMNRVGAALAGEHDLERLVQLVTDAGVELSRAAFGAFFYNVVDTAGESYMLYSLSGVEREAFADFPMPRNTQVFAPTFQGDGIVRSDDITLDPRYGHNKPGSGMPAGHLPVRSYLAVPVMSSEGEVLGGLFFGHPEPGRFQQADEGLVAGLAGQAAVAIENARLIQRVREASDMLERRVSERTAELTQAHEALRHAQKLEAIGQLTGGVAHDFNNLLTVIAGAAEMLAKPDLPEHKRARYIENIASTARRASTLTSHLLAFSRRRVIRPEVVDLNIQIDALEEVLARSLGGHIQIEVRPSAREARVEVDPTEFETAILNAAVNARNAMPDGGTLSIAIRDHDLANEPGVAIDITDTGMGMSPDTVKRVFEPFFTTKPVGEGTGLGLSQIHGFAAQAGGSAEIFSREGIGTTIRIILPRVDKALRTMEEKRMLEPIPQGLKVLLVEDNDQVRHFAEHLLHDLGAKVTAVANGSEALGALQEDPFDLIFTDVVMPGLSGIDLARQLRVRAPDLPVLLATGYSEQMIGEGIDEFDVLAKPYGAEALSLALKKILPIS